LNFQLDTNQQCVTI